MKNIQDCLFLFFSGFVLFCYVGCVCVYGFCVVINVVVFVVVVVVFLIILLLGFFVGFWGWWGVRSIYLVIESVY